MSDLDLLPDGLRAESRMEREIALPFPVVLDAVRLIEEQGVFLLGWEALATYPDGGFGAYPCGGVVSFSIEPPAHASERSRAVRHAADEMRRTITDEATTRSLTPPIDGVELIFCITCEVRDLDIRRPELLGVRRTGSVRWWKDEKGYGRITADDGEVLWAHHTRIVGRPGSLDEGDRVSFVWDGGIQDHGRHAAVEIRLEDSDSALPQ